MKRAQKLISIILMVTMLTGIISIFPVSVSAATTPSKVSNSEAYNKIYNLYSVLGEGSYFTTTHSNSCGSKSSGHACSYCKLSSILNKSWFINKFGTLSVSQFPSTYYSDGKAHGPDGWSCFGFASFAEWYVFHTNKSDKVTTSYVGTYSYDYANAQKYIKTGDLIRVDDGHSAIAISCNSTGVEVLDSNWSGSYNCQVYIHTIKYTSKNMVSVSRATNSEASSVTNTDTTYSSKNPDDYTYPTSTIYRTSPTMKGSTVAWVQAVLYQLGYSIEIDGSYGANSEAVVKQFQSANGLEVDGRVGPATRAKLLELWNAKKHTHSLTVLTETAHPHKVYKSCSCGYKEYTGEYKTVYTCNGCLPEKSVLTVVAGTSLDYTSFSWKAAEGADCYELIVYRKGEDKPVQWLYNLTTNQHKLMLSAGDYTAYVASINNDLIDTSCWWVYSDKVEFSVLEKEAFAPLASTGFNGNKYELYDVTMSWTEAKAKCEELGGHLVVVNTEDEYDIVKSLMSNGSSKVYWLGLTDSDTEGQWVSVTDEDILHTNWSDGEPNDYNGEEDFAVIKNDNSYEYNDVKNEYTSVVVGFICEYEPEDNIDDEHVHDYYITDSNPSTCSEYGYTVYACDCGDNYKKYETELEEHHILSRYDVIESSADNVGFIGDYCYRCSYINNCKVVYPDGTEKSVYLSKDSDGYNSLKEIIGIYKELLLEIDLKASLSTDDERTIDFSWSTVDEVKATDDEAISTEDEISYYELSIYKDNELVETIRTVTPNCVWMFGSDYYFTVVISAFNSDGDILAISSVFAVDVDTICVDYFDNYGNVDRKGDINVKDATLIQKYLANLVELEKYPLRLADVNSDGKVNIKDATAIQKYCAKIDVDSRIGNECWDGYVEYSGVRVALAR